MLYNIPAFAGTKDFMIAVARVRGRLRKGGIPDLVGTARSILRDWNAGRIPYYTVPPEVPQGATASSSSTSAATNKSMLTTSADVGSAAIVSTLAPEFDLDGLFQEADAGALEGVKSSKEMAPGSVVRLNESIMSMNLDSAADEGDFKLMGEDVMLANAAATANDEDDEVPMLVPTPGSSSKASTTRNKKKRKSEVAELGDEGDESVVSLPPSTKQKKSVTFESSQKAKMFADAPEEAPVQLNKAIKQQAKKDKKKKEKAARSAMQDVQGASNGDEDIDDDAPRPYDFAKFFGAPAAAVPDEDEEM